MAAEHLGIKGMAGAKLRPQALQAATMPVDHSVDHRSGDMVPRDPQHPLQTPLFSFSDPAVRLAVHGDDDHHP
jgi:hypothetical protein